VTDLPAPTGLGGVALIDHSSRFERAWQVIVGAPGSERWYRADVLVLPLANAEPPEMMGFELVPVPGHLVDAGVTLVDWFMVGARGHVALQACELISATRTEITEDEYHAMTRVPEVPMAVLVAEDFAGPAQPNRAQRRAMEQRPRRGRR
jgi:hypothetical protein